MRRYRLEPPVAGRALLVRERLLAALRARWHVPVTVVTAPAGYGKTTLLAQAVTDNAAAPRGEDCWLSLDPEAAVASHLAGGLRAAVGARNGDGADRDGGPVADPVADAVADVTDALWRRAPRQVALVVDDLHHVAPGSPGAELLAGLVATLPDNAHVVLAARGAVPVPLARLEVRGDVRRLDERDLALTGDELAAYGVLRAVPAADLVSCGGWPALAELMASASPAVTSTYVGEEVLAALPAHRRRMLALLASLGTVDDDLVAALGSRDRAEDVLDGLPLVTRDATGGWEVHALWATLLDGEVSADARRAAHRRVAAQLRARGEPARAVRLLADAAAWDDVAGAIVDALGAAHPPVPHDELAAWLDRLPRRVRDDPAGRLLAAVVQSEPDPAGAAAGLEAAAAAFGAAGDAAGELACLVQLGQIAWWSERPELLAALAMRVIQLDGEGCAAAAPLACIARALVHDVRNESREVLAELDRIPPGSLNDVWRGVVSWLRSTTFMHLGDAAAARGAAEDALAHAGPLHRPLAEGAWLQARWFEGGSAGVTARLPDLAASVRRAGFRNHAAVAATQAGLAAAMADDERAATEFLAKARLDGGSRPIPLLDTDMAIASAAAAVAAADEPRAARVLADSLQRRPLGDGHSAAPQQRSLALYYVLVPDTREAWASADLGPAFVTARELARALVAVRESGTLQDTPGLPDPGIVTAHLPRRWAVELGLAAVSAERDDGWRLVEALWPAARRQVAAVASAPGPLRRAARSVLSRLPVPPAGPIELRLLGPVELVRDGAVVGDPDWRRERVRSLLAHLALHGPVSRARVADDLWPSLDADAQSRNLRVTLTYLLRVLEPDRRPREASWFVRQDGASIALHPGDALTSDVWRFDAAATRAVEAERSGSPARELAAAEEAVSLWRSEPADLVGEPWALPLIEPRRARYAALAARAGELILARGDVRGAVAHAARALAVDPFLEPAHRLTVAAHHAAGDLASAHLALARYRAAVDDLGIGPEEATLMVERLVDAAAYPLVAHPATGE